MADPCIRIQALEALKLHGEGQHAKALTHAMELARTNPDSAPTLNLAGALHVLAPGTGWKESALGDDKDACSEVRSLPHHRGRNADPAAEPVKGPALKRLGSSEEEGGHDEVALASSFAFPEREQDRISNVAALTAMLDEDMYMGDKKAEWCSGA